MRIMDVYRDKQNQMHLARFIKFKEGKDIREIAKEEGKHYQTIRQSVQKGLKFYEAQKSQGQG